MVSTLNSALRSVGSHPRENSNRRAAGRGGQGPRRRVRCGVRVPRGGARSAHGRGQGGGGLRQGAKSRPVEAEAPASQGMERWRAGAEAAGGWGPA